MNRYKHLVFLTFTAIMFFSMGHLLAWDRDTFLDFSTGIRCDKIKTDVQSFDAAGVLTNDDRIEIAHLFTYDVGLIGRYFFTNSFYFRGAADFGSIMGDGGYGETVTDGTTTVDIVTHTRRGTVLDFTGGVGYFFHLNRCWGIAPVAGWAFDSQRVKIKDVTVNTFSAPILNGVRYDNRWQGPWVGVDVIFATAYKCMFDFVVNAGYEFHYGNWRAKWIFKHPDVFNGSFSDIRKANNVFAHVFYVDGRFNFNDCWNMGVGIKLQDWNVNHGTSKPLKVDSFSQVSSTTTSAKVKNASWVSAAITYELGFNF